MAYTAQLTAALSGASMRQLGYWRRTAAFTPEIRSDRPIFYSFRDIAALRAFVFLRQQTSLQSIRAAIASLRGLGELEHLSRYKLVANGGTVIVRLGDDVVDLVRLPGHGLVADFSEVLAEFTMATGATVPNLRRPRPHVTVDPAMRGGHPVIAGTRVPFELVAGLVEDGVAPEDVALFYPGVNAAAARDAADFALYVATHSEAPAA